MMAVLGRLGLLLLAVALQTSWPRALRPGGITPDLTLALVLALALTGSPGFAMLCSLIGGSLLDLLSSLPAATHVLSHAAAVGAVTLVALGPHHERPWLVIALPALGTTVAYAVAGMRLHLAGMAEVWPAVGAALPVAVVQVSGLLLGGWLLVAWLRTLHHRPVRR